MFVPMTTQQIAQLHLKIRFF